MGDVNRTSLDKTVKDFLDKSRDDEKLVMGLLESVIGGKCMQASSNDDKYNHIDVFWITPKDIKLGIDVKGRHKSVRKDKEYNDEIQWLELQNVKGNDGWLKGKAYYIAFCTSDKIIFCKREKLLAYAVKMTEGKEVSTDNPKGCYIPYKRAKYGRDDVLVKVPTDDIEKLSDFTIKTA